MLFNSMDSFDKWKMCGITVKVCIESSDNVDGSIFHSDTFYKHSDTHRNCSWQEATKHGHVMLFLQIVLVIF